MKYRESKSSDCKRSSVEFIDLDNTKLDADIVKSIPDNLAKRYNAIPIDIVGNTMKLAMAEPDNILAIDDIRLVTGYDIEPFQAEESAIKRAINRFFGDQYGDYEVEKMDIADTDDSSVGIVFKLIIEVAIKDRVSEIRIISEKDKFVVYYVENGNMREVMQPPNNIKKEMLTYIKVLSNLDVLRNNIQQDGKITYKYEGIKHEVMVSIVPSSNDENVIMKILN